MSSARSYPSVSENDTSDLIAKLEGATGPDRALDYQVIYVTRPESVAWGVFEYPFPEFCKSAAAYDEFQGEPLCGLLTASLDAALALVGEKLPEWTTDVHTAPPTPTAYPIRKDIRLYDDGSCEVEIFYCHPKIEPREIGSGYHSSSAPIAVLIALLKALADGSNATTSGNTRPDTL